MGHKYTKEEIIQLCERCLVVAEEYAIQAENVEAVSADMLPWIEQFGSWGWVYTKPFGELIGKLLGLLGKDADLILPAPEGLAQKDWDISALQAHYATPPDMEGVHQPLFVHMILAYQGHVRSLDVFSQSMDVLVAKAGEGQDDALFQAVFIDPVVLACPAVQTRIAKATLLKDEEFFNQLTKALKKSKPRRPSEKYDPIRYLIGILDEIHALDNLTQTQVCEIFIDHLNLYPHDSEDAHAGLKKLIQEIRKQAKR